MAIARNSPEDGEQKILEESVKLDTRAAKYDPYCGGHMTLNLCGSHPPPIPPGYDPFCGGHMNFNLCPESLGGRLAISNTTIISTVILAVFLLAK
ncbi:hypothetical protein ACHQM5_024977 [Ranunculus cassubicifolius]